jgi:hypothetical protein
MTPLLRTAAFLVKTTELSGPWHSALKLSHQTLAVRSTPIFALAIRGVHSFDSITNLSAGFSKRVKSSPRHFTSRDLLFEALDIFDAQLFKCKTETLSRDTIPLISGPFYKFGESVIFSDKLLCVMVHRLPSVR